MDRAEAKERIKQEIDIREFLEPARGANQFVCPFCGSGGHDGHSTAAMHYYEDTNTVACFSTACTQGTATAKKYDVFDVAGNYYGTDFAQTFAILAQKAGIELNTYQQGINTPPPRKSPSQAEFKPSDGMQSAKKQADYTKYYKTCWARLRDIDRNDAVCKYLESRGINKNLAWGIGLGFDPAADPAGAPGGSEPPKHPAPRIIVPVSESSYIGVSIDPDTPPGYKKLNNRGACAGIFNAKTMYHGVPRPIFVTEGVFDALSVEMTGHSAIALNSANNAQMLIDTITKKPPTGVSHFVICLDSDRAGKTGTAVLAEGLPACTIADICGPYKDPNEYLQRDKGSFLSAVKAAAEAKPRPSNSFGAWLDLRGIRQETAEAAGVVYDKSKHAAIFPCGDSASCAVPVFTAGKPTYTAATAAPFGLEKALSDPADKRPIYLVWDAVSALALMDDGYKAVALCDPAASEYFVSQVSAARPACPVVLAITAGTRDRVRQHLTTAGITAYTADLRGNFASAWQYRLHSPQEFAATAEAAGKGEVTGAADYISSCLIDDIEAFKTDIKTGFDNYDAETGGLYSGLYVIGAISSLGKTTFAHQMADQIAAAGGHVLFFSLEQSRFELITKSIARETYLRDAETARSAMAIRRMKGRLDADTAQTMAEYADKVGNRLQIYESVFDCTASQVEQITREYMARKGVTPVVIVDYLQVLQPEPDAKQTDIRTTVDAALTRFERLAKGSGAPVIVISSVNRQNYSSPIDFAAFKESGGIEYTADVVIGLQLEIMNCKLYTQSEKKEIHKRTLAEIAKCKIPRRIEAKVLKNRYGKTRFSLHYEYHPVYDTFVPCEPLSSAELAALEKEASEAENRRAKSAIKAVTL